MYYIQYIFIIKIIFPSFLLLSVKYFSFLLFINKSRFEKNERFYIYQSKYFLLKLYHSGCGIKNIYRILSVKLITIIRKITFLIV